MERKRERKRGFTLIELLVVVAIVALLVAILMPALSKARELAKIAVCLVNFRTVGMAFAQYEAANEGCSPRAFVSPDHRSELELYVQEASGLTAAQLGWGDAPTYTPPTFQGRNYSVALWPYYKDMKAFMCPTDPAAGTTARDRLAYSNRVGYGEGAATPFGAWIDAPRSTYYVNYATVDLGWGKLRLWPTGGIQDKTFNAGTKYLTIDQVTRAHGRSPSGLYRVSELGWGLGLEEDVGWMNPWDPYTGNWGANYALVGGFRAVSKTMPPTGEGLHPDWPTGASGTWESHPRSKNRGMWGWDNPDSGANYLFMDGHAEYRKAMPGLEESGCAAGS